MRRRFPVLIQRDQLAGRGAARYAAAKAGRQLFAASRSKRTSTNDADRLRKYLARFGLSWETVIAPCGA